MSDGHNPQLQLLVRSCSRLWCRIIQVEVDHDRGVYFGWLTVQQVRPIRPLLDGVERCYLKFLWSGDYLERLHRAFLADEGVQHNCTANSRFPRLSRIDWRRLAQDIARHNTT